MTQYSTPTHCLQVFSASCASTAEGCGGLEINHHFSLIAGSNRSPLECFCSRRSIFRREDRPDYGRSTIGGPCAQHSSRRARWGAMIDLVDA
jgi:hypothetical protein